MAKNKSAMVERFGETIGDRLREDIAKGREPSWHHESDVGGPLGTEIAFQRAMEHVLRLLSVEKSSDAIAKLAQSSQFLAQAATIYFQRQKR